MCNIWFSLANTYPIKRCISAAAFGRMAEVLTSIDRSSSTFCFQLNNMIFSWRILMRVVILILPVVLGWVSGVATPSRDACRGYSVGRAKINSYRRMYVRRFFVFPSLTFVLVFDTLRSPDVSGLASDEATLAPVACGGRSDCRELSSFLILVWTCVTHVRYLYRVWAFFIRFLVLQRTVEWIALRSFRIDLIHLKEIIGNYNYGNSAHIPQTP